MNPLFKAITGGFAPVSLQTGISPSAVPGGGMGNVLARAQQLAGMMQNPQRLVSQFFPDAPAEVTCNPDQLVDWMQQTGRVNPQMVQMARQMLGR